jgi:hypothetical protein
MGLHRLNSNGTRNASGHRHRSWTSDLFPFQPRLELRGSPVETGFSALYVLVYNGHL